MTASGYIMSGLDIVPREESERRLAAILVADALSVTFRGLHDHSGAGGSVSHICRVYPAAATKSWTGERTKAVTMRI
jgi:hypothetical protein